MSVPPGRYRHYKGNEYTVMGIARHSETDEELVVYEVGLEDSLATEIDNHRTPPFQQMQYTFQS